MSGEIIRDSTPTGGRPNVRVFFAVKGLGKKLELAKSLGAEIVISPTQFHRPR